MTNINSLLDKADRVYHQLMGHRPQLENLLCKVNEAAPEKPQVRRARWSLHRPAGWGHAGLDLPKALLAQGLLCTCWFCVEPPFVIPLGFLLFRMSRAAVEGSALPQPV